MFVCLILVGIDLVELFTYCCFARCGSRWFVVLVWALCGRFAVVSGFGWFCGLLFALV